jgi:hypothetical protein
VAPVRHSGDRIAERYRLEECISQAGVFTSWRAVDEKLNRAVGIHLLSSGNQRARRVLAAARSAALLGDLRFVQVLDAVQSPTEPARLPQNAGGDGGTLVYVVREWLPRATDLGTLIARDPLEAHEAYQMIHQVADAMASAHRRGMCHLRLTPSCVLRSETGQYRINGLAMDAALNGLDTEPAEPAATGDSAADTPDTPDTPDTADVTDAELRDTRAMGALLYASLTGRWPTEEDSYGIPGLPRGTGEAAPVQIRAGVHRGLSDLAARCLFTDPGRRLEPITTPGRLAEAVAALPRIRPPEPAAAVGTATAPGVPAAPSVNRGADHPVPPGYAGDRGGHGGRTAPPQGAARPGPPPALPGRTGKAVKWTVGAVLVAAIGLGSWGLAETILHNGDRSGQTVQSDTATNGASGRRPTGRALNVADAREFSPLAAPIAAGDVHFAVDGKSATPWITSHYDGYADFGNLPSRKEGGGIWVDLGSVRRVTGVQVDFPVAGQTVDVRAVPKGGGDPSAADLDGWSEVLRSSGQTGSTLDVALSKPVTTRYVLVHLSALPTMPGSSDTYRGGISEITVFGRRS